MQWKIEIPDWHATDLNTLLKSHWGTRSKLKQADRNVIARHANEAGIPKSGKVKRRVRITYIVERGSGKRYRDDDNVWKSLLDGMKKAGLIYDDSPYWLAKEPVQYGRADQCGTIIELEDVA